MILESAVVPGGYKDMQLDDTNYANAIGDWKVKANWKNILFLAPPITVENKKDGRKTAVANMLLGAPPIIPTLDILKTNGGFKPSISVDIPKKAGAPTPPVAPPTAPPTTPPTTPPATPKPTTPPTPPPSTQPPIAPAGVDPNYEANNPKPSDVKQASMGKKAMYIGGALVVVAIIIGVMKHKK